MVGGGGEGGLEAGEEGWRWGRRREEGWRWGRELGRRSKGAIGGGWGGGSIDLSVVEARNKGYTGMTV